MIFILFFIFFNILSNSVTLENLKTTFPQDYAAFKIETEGSFLKKAIRAKSLPILTIFATTTYLTYKQKKALNVSDMPKLVLPLSISMGTEKMIEAAGYYHEKKYSTKKQKTMIF